jgi:hypothetical protein
MSSTDPGERLLLEEPEQLVSLPGLHPHWIQPRLKGENVGFSTWYLPR